MSASVLFDAPGPKARRRAVIFNILGGLLLAAGVLWVYMTLAAPKVTAGGQTRPGLFDVSRWDVFWTRPEMWPVVWNGVWATLSAAGIAAVLAILLGMVFAVLGSSQSTWVTRPTVMVLEFFRGMPVLLMIFFMLIVVVKGAPFWAVILGLAVYNGALIGEILRAGLKSLPRGQREAGLSVGLTPLKTLLLVEFPQAFRQMTPIIVAQLVVLLKDTSLGYIVAYEEILRTNMNILASYFGSDYIFSFFFLTLVIYMGINLIVSWFARYLSKRLTASKGAKPRAGKVAKGEDGPLEPTPTQLIRAIPSDAPIQSSEGDRRV